jgi:hypothetical protein
LDGKVKTNLSFALNVDRTKNATLYTDVAPVNVWAGVIVAESKDPGRSDPRVPLTVSFKKLDWSI